MSKAMNFYLLQKNKGGKYGQKFLDRTKKLTTNTLKKTLKKVIQETLEEKGDLCENKIEEKITKLLQIILVRIQENLLPQK